MRLIPSLPAAQPSSAGRLLGQVFAHTTGLACFTGPLALLQSDCSLAQWLPRCVRDHHTTTGPDGSVHSTAWTRSAADIDCSPLACPSLAAPAQPYRLG
ncbi:hypothetical protein RRG08_019577 [Elysia crispata]|uniref:Uncharacterized protein n=1 Tax=Elysia crispata TaxID=231223 RepID=A0AAE0YQY6_9GAST|nr:hypothetical protein RRG08_019577 [Elysia crispata]